MRFWHFAWSPLIRLLDESGWFFFFSSGEKSAGEIFEEQRRESDINTVVMPSRDFETIAIAMSKGGDTSSRLLDKRQRRGAAMHFVVYSEIMSCEVSTETDGYKFMLCMNMFCSREVCYLVDTFLHTYGESYVCKNAILKKLPSKI